jgi:hypothetical protein
MEREKMKLRARIAWVVGVTVLALTTVSVAQEQTATVPDSTEAVPVETVVASDSTATVPTESLESAPTIPDSSSPTEEAVTFSDINDAVPGKYFDAAATAPGPRQP